MDPQRGDWSVRHAGYRHDGNSEKGKKGPRFEPSSTWALRGSRGLSSNANRATAVPILIHHMGGIRVTLDQQKIARAEPFALVGMFVFPEGSASRSATRGRTDS